MLVFFGRALEVVRDVLTRHKLNYVLLITGIVLGGAAGLVVAVEGGAPGATIDSFGDAFWWAISTVTTVGNGDAFPTTTAGRGVGIVLMILGIAIFGLLAASLAAYFVEEDEEKHFDPQLAEINQRLERIEQALLSESKK